MEHFLIDLVNRILLKSINIYMFMQKDSYAFCPLELFEMMWLILQQGWTGFEILWTCRGRWCLMHEHDIENIGSVSGRQQTYWCTWNRTSWQWLWPIAVLLICMRYNGLAVVMVDCFLIPEHTIDRIGSSFGWLLSN